MQRDSSRVSFRQFVSTMLTRWPRPLYNSRMRKEIVQTSVNQWGNGLAVRLTKSVARVAGVTEGSRVRIVAQKGRIVIETESREPSLEEMLAGFDPKRHGGELMAYTPIGKEVL